MSTFQYSPTVCVNATLSVYSTFLSYSSLMWCAVVYRLHLCGPDSEVSFIILCHKAVLIMGHYPHWLPAPFHFIAEHLLQSYLFIASVTEEGNLA